MATLDDYVVQARLKPAFIVGLPLILLAFVWPVDGDFGTKVFAGTLTTCGATALLARLGGYLGKKRESALWDHFGGRPTEKILSHDSGKTNPHTLARWHTKLEALSGIHMPTAEEESREPYAAEQAYESAVRFLRAHTRDTKKYPLVALTNRDFGFARNTWAMKPIGLPVSAVVAFGMGWMLFWDLRAHLPIERTVVGVLAVSSSLCLFWLWVNRQWVRQAADRYALALLETLDIPVDK